MPMLNNVYFNYNKNYNNKCNGINLVAISTCLYSKEGYLCQKIATFLMPIGYSFNPIFRNDE